MRLNEISFDNALPIDGYGPGFFRIGGEVRKGGQMILPLAVREWAGYGDTQSILDAADTLDVLFVGTGADTAHPPVEFRELLEQAGIGVEPMATPAACRTFNILLSEGRRVGAALLPV